MKNPFENKKKHIRIKGPTPNTKRTIFAVLGVVFFSKLGSMILEDTFLLDFLLGITKIKLIKNIIEIIFYDRKKISEHGLTSFIKKLNLSILIIELQFQNHIRDVYTIDMLNTSR